MVCRGLLTDRNALHLLAKGPKCISWRRNQDVFINVTEKLPRLTIAFRGGRQKKRTELGMLARL